MTTLAPETTDAAPAYAIPCWVSTLGGWSFTPDGTTIPCAEWCVDKIAEWETTNGASPLWLPTCTGCKDRFVRLNPDTLVRRLL